MKYNNYVWLIVFWSYSDVKKYLIEDEAELYLTLDIECTAVSDSKHLSATISMNPQMKQQNVSYVVCMMSIRTKGLGQQPRCKSVLRYLRI